MRSVAPDRSVVLAEGEPHCPALMSTVMSTHCGGADEAPKAGSPFAPIPLATDLEPPSRQRSRPFPRSDWAGYTAARDTLRARARGSNGGSSCPPPGQLNSPAEIEVVLLPPVSETSRLEILRAELERIPGWTGGAARVTVAVSSASAPRSGRASGPFRFDVSNIGSPEILHFSVRAVAQTRP